MNPTFSVTDIDKELTQDSVFFKTILSSFLEILQEELDKSEQHWKSNDRKGFGASMHKIKPNFSYLNLKEGYTLTKELEELAKNNGSPEDITVKFAALKVYSQTVIPEIQSYLEQYK